MYNKMKFGVLKNIKNKEYIFAVQIKREVLCYIDEIKERKMQLLLFNDCSDEHTATPYIVVQLRCFTVRTSYSYLDFTCA